MEKSRTVFISKVTETTIAIQNPDDYHYKVDLFIRLLFLFNVRDSNSCEYLFVRYEFCLS